MKEGYPWIDIIRIIAAVFVIAIHISPLEQISPLADLFVTRILGRLAVPFFFIVTAYFLFLKGYPSLQRIKTTFINLFKWYMLAMMIYIPLMLYNHYFSQDDLLMNVFKDFLIDGMFYHLWYFPAVMIGLIIVLFLRKYLSLSMCLCITCFLYMIGLCGDAYYGLANQVTFFNNMLAWLFQWMDYTRNGFFFAPLFLMIGVMISEQKRILRLDTNIVLCVISFVLMSFEAYLVHDFSICRHDAMYLFLPLTSYFFFQILIRQRGKRILILKDLSLDMYILHPLMIVVVRMIGKFMHMQELIQNNLMQFLCVVVLTLCGSILLERVKVYVYKV